MHSLIPHLQLTISIIVAATVVYLHFNGKVKELILPFFVMGFSLVFWQLCDFLAYYMKDNLTLSTFWEKNAYIGVPVFIASLFHYSVEITDNRKQKKFLAAVYVFSLILAFSVRFPSFILGLRELNYNITIIPGKLFPLMILSYIAIFVLGLVIIISDIIKTRAIFKKERLKYALFGFILCIFGCIDFITIYINYIIPLGFIFVFFGILSFFYIITEEESMEMRLFMHRVAAYAGSYILLLLLLLLILHLTNRNTPAEIMNTYYSNILVLGLFLFVFIPLLMRIKDRIAIHFDRIALVPYERLIARIESFIKEFSIYTDLEQLLVFVVFFFQRGLGFEKVSFILYDEHFNSYRVAEGDIVGCSDIIFPKNEKFILWMMKHKQLLMRDEIESLPRFAEIKESAIEAFDSLGVRFFMPLSRETASPSHLLGVIALGDSEFLDFRKKWSRKLLEFLGKDISSTLNQAIMCKKREEEMILLSRFRDKVIAVESVDIVLKNLVDTIKDMMIVERISILMLDDDDETKLRIKESHGIPEEISKSVRIDINDEKRISAWVFKHKKALLSDDVGQTFEIIDERKTPRKYNTRSCVSVPIVICGEPIGVINVNNKITGEPFNKGDLEVLNGLAYEASFSIIWAQIRQADQSRVGNLVRTLAKTLEAKDPFTRGHSDRVAEYASYIAFKMNLSMEQYTNLHSAGSLHDIGKVGIPDSLLLKPSHLTDEEFDVVKEHSIAGEEILRQADISEEIILGVKHHHERYDGSGYPDGLKGDQIPLIARILAVADAFDAMMSNRAYRNKMEFEIAKKQIEYNKGKQFDPKCADLFLKWLEENAHKEVEDFIKNRTEENAKYIKQRRFGEEVK